MRVDVPLLATLIDVIIAVTVAELLGLLLWHRVTGRGVAPRELVPSLVAGLLLMAALRLAVSGAAMAWLMLCFLGSGIAHAADLRRRWRSSGAQAGNANGARHAAPGVLVPGHLPPQQLDTLADAAKPQAM